VKERKTQASWTSAQAQRYLVEAAIQAHRDRPGADGALAQSQGAAFIVMVILSRHF
jgi:hypothetical protein